MFFGKPEATAFPDSKTVTPAARRQTRRALAAGAVPIWEFMVYDLSQFPNGILLTNHTSAFPAEPRDSNTRVRKLDHESNLQTRTTITSRDPKNAIRRTDCLAGSSGRRANPQAGHHHRRNQRSVCRNVSQLRRRAAVLELRRKRRRWRPPFSC